MGSNPTPTVAEARARLVNQGTTRLRILRVARGENAGAWARVLPTLTEHAPGSQPLKQQGPDAVWVAAALGRQVIIKRRHAPGFGEFVRRCVGRSRAQRQWQGSTLLDLAGIPTARCLVLARFGQSEWLVMDHLPGASLLSVLARNALTPAAAHALALAAGRLVARMAAEGLFNRDQKPSNIIVTNLDNTNAHLAVIDTVGVRRVSAWREDFTVRMLASLVIEPSGTGISIPRAAMMRALTQVVPDRAHRRTLWRAVAQSVQLHGDPTPRVDPLSVA